MTVTIPQAAADSWEAVYYPNPVPLSSKCLLACALLFDRVHLPGVSIPQVRISDDLKPRLRDEFLALTRAPATQNLALWAMEQPSVADFIHLPDQRLLDSNAHHTWNVKDSAFQRQISELLDDTYGDGMSANVEWVYAAEAFRLPGSDETIFALTWPLYQARALQHSHNTGLPLISDDPDSIPPLPNHPSVSPDTKGLAQQLAVQPVSLVLPPFRSVDPARVSEFRSAIQPLTRPFRIEMIRLTAELRVAIASGTPDAELQRLCRGLAEARVLPALADLSMQLSDPVKPWHKIALDITEASLATLASSVSPSLTVAWALLRGAKILSEYAQLYTDREGKKKSGLSYLLKIRQHSSADAVARVSDWDKRDWRCSGFVYVPDPGAPINRQNQELMAGPEMEHIRASARTMRRIEQTRTTSVIWART